MLVPEQRACGGPSIKSPQRLAVLGCTGSIGFSTLDVVRAAPGQFEIFALVARDSAQQLLDQVREFRPRYGVLTEPSAQSLELIRTAAASGLGEVEFAFGEEAAIEVAAHPQVTTVVAAIVGFAGLPAVLNTLKAGKRVALANKESLVAAGRLVREAQLTGNAEIVPVDSEHSAIFQALRGESLQDVRKLILTASGGPFLNLPKGEFARVTPEQALNHPRWRMGAKVTVDSASMMNKALELIEACWLFDLPPDRVEVLVHPQSIVHSLVEYVDGTQIAQLSVPDMRGPIAYALGYPAGRIGQAMQPLDLAEVGRLEFFPLDNDKFPAVALAREVMELGGAAPAVFNFANEYAVSAFLERRAAFDRIVPLVAECVRQFAGRDYANLEDLLALREEVREKVRL